MRAKDLMTPNPSCCSAEDTVEKAAQKMIGQDCGCLPVVDRDNRIVGTVTDRDLAVRVLARGKGADTRVGEVMSTEPSCCSPRDDVRTVERIMEERQVRRVPVVDESGRCIGAESDVGRRPEAR